MVCADVLIEKIYYTEGRNLLYNSIVRARTRTDLVEDNYSQLIQYAKLKKLVTYMSMNVVRSWYIRLNDWHVLHVPRVLLIAPPVVDMAMDKPKQN